MKTKILFLILTFAWFISLSACTSPVENDVSDNSRIITVSVLPEKYFVERIGGEHVQVNVMVGPGESPHSYEPKAKQMAALSNSALYFAIGVEFEDAWMERITSANPGLRVVDLSQDISKLPSSDADHNEDMDPHIWTSPEMGKTIARKIGFVLIELDPQHADDYQANLAVLLRDIEQLQAEITNSISQMDTHQFMVFHPGWGYFANEFGLEQIPIEIGGSEPSASELAHLIDTAKNDNIRVIFAQPELSTQSADFIASEIGGRVILISPLAEDWLENLRLVSQTFADAL
ncbi:MAG: zinc ABC transporter substrate-binding protein [Pelolinea sp.]|nr:zinc ABC transporter substrate-binding protein [Pelolinea sp.]